VKLKLASFGFENFAPAIAVARVATGTEMAEATRRWDDLDRGSSRFWPSVSRRVGYRSYYLVTLRLRDYSNDPFEFCGLQELDRFAHADDGVRLFHPLYQQDF
jgi:hypothetical protein